MASLVPTVGRGGLFRVQKALVGPEKAPVSLFGSRYSLARRGLSDVTVMSEKTSIFGGGIVKEQIHPPDKSKHPPFLKHPKTCALIGMPFSWGQPRQGTDQGPELMRKRGIAEYISKLQWRTEERGDLKFDEPKLDDPASQGLKNAYAVGKACETLSKETYKVASEGKFSLVMGGDHSIAMGSIAGLLRKHPDLAVIWVDAHADINTPALSPSGNLHGMPLAFLMGLVEDLPPGFEWLDEHPKLKPENVAYIGLRDVDPGETALIRKLGISAYSMYHVDRYGIGQVMEHALHSISPDNAKPLHLSYDIDAVDPDHAPATGTMVRGGFTLREAHYVCERVAESGMLGSMDIVEVNPTLSHTEGANATVELGVHLVASALGNTIL